MSEISAPPATRCDLLVIGSGAGGLSAALTGAILGLKVLMVEKEAVFGGTTAWSGGWMWIPRNPLAVAAGIVERPEEARTYLRHELGEHFDEPRIDAFLKHGARMIDFFQRRAAIEFIDGNLIPDFHGNSPGARAGGRSLCAAPFDARKLGAQLARLRPPLDLISPWGMGIASGPELRHFLNATRSWRSLAYVARRLSLHLRDLLMHRRGMRLVNGNALVARLAHAAFERGVELRVCTPALRLLREDDRVIGAIVGSADGEAVIRAQHGVVLACGGFPHDTGRKKELFAHAPSGHEHWSAAPPSNTGDGLRLGVAVGATIAADLAAAGAWAPVSLVSRGDGTVAHFPHLIERAKPGLIAVTRRGLRFVNEADSYHDFMRGLFGAIPDGETVEAWLICDHRFVRRYGLGNVRPAPFPRGAHVRSGYLKRAPTIAGLALACGIDPTALADTVRLYNGAAQDGRDPFYGRGETPYNRAQGDATQAPNPCVAPVEHAPFYAVRVVPGSLGTFAGLRTDACARVLDRNGAPIAGLYASGNDMASVMGGHYPAGGITLGPAMTFGFLAAHHAARQSKPSGDPHAVI